MEFVPLTYYCCCSPPHGTLYARYAEFQGSQLVCYFMFCSNNRENGLRSLEAAKGTAALETPARQPPASRFFAPLRFGRTPVRKSRPKKKKGEEAHASIQMNRLLQDSGFE